MNDVLRPLVILVLVSLSSCGSGSKRDRQPSTVVRNFLAWYKQNYAELNPLTLGKYGVTDTTVMFVVDTTRTRRYIELIR